MEVNFLQHVIYKILNAPVRYYPYPHLYIEDIFPQKFYEKLLSNLPEDKFMPTIEELGKVAATGKYEARSVLPLQTGFLENLPSGQVKFWKAFSKKMSSKSLEIAFCTKFDALNLQKETLITDVELVRDREGYALFPHTDVKWKYITALFYLPEDDRYSKYGTSVLVPKVQNARQGYEDDFDLVYTAPYKANSFFCFFRSDHSWHSVLPVDDPTLVRNSLCWRLRTHD